MKVWHVPSRPRRLVAVTDTGVVGAPVETFDDVLRVWGALVPWLPADSYWTITGA